MHRDVRVDAAGWSGLRTALAAMTASAVPHPSTVPPQPAGPLPQGGGARQPGPSRAGSAQSSAYPEYPPGPAEAERHPAGDFPAGRYPADRYPSAAQYPAGQDPAEYDAADHDAPERDATAQYPGEQYPGEQYQAGQYPDGRYASGHALNGVAADVGQGVGSGAGIDAGSGADGGAVPTVPGQAQRGRTSGRTPAPPPDFSRPDAAQAESLRMLALVKLAQDGDGEAFGQLYDAYSDTVFRYVYYRVSNRQLAEDITSETFLRALRRIGTFTWQGRDFGAWLVTIARNLVADHFKSSRYRLEVPTGEMMDSNETECSPEDSVLSYLSNRALLDAVCQLNSQQQECVTLRFLHGLSVAETAKIMGKNDGAIKTLQYRAIRTLARLLPVDLR